MLAVLYGLVFMVGGIAAVRFLLPQKRMIVRLWLGAALGLALMMWLPALCAFALRFSLAAHGLALALLLLLVAGAYLGRSKRPAAAWSADDARLGKLLLWEMKYPESIRAG